MVAGMNVADITQTQTPTESPKGKADSKLDENMPSFSEALATKEAKDAAKQKDKAAANGETDPKAEAKPNDKNTKDIKGEADSKDKDPKATKAESDSKDGKTQAATPNPLTTKPTKTQAESALTKALKNEDSDDEDTGDIALGESDGEVLLDSEDTPTDGAKKTDAKALDSKQAKQAGEAGEKKRQNSKLESGAQAAQSGNIAGDMGDESSLDVEADEVLAKADSKSLDSKAKSVADPKEAQLKSLNDVKKEAQARNLNLQKMEIIEQGKKTPINPQDLMDRDLLDSNKERLALSLQDKGRAVSNSLAKSSPQEMGETAKKEAMLAELLNRYDANANAKRKAQNENEKLQFKVGDGDKAMIVERTTIQPKNITDSKMRNEIKEHEFLEELHNITGDEELGEILETNKARITAHIAQQTTKISNGKDGVVIAKTYQGWAQQGQFLDPKEIKEAKNAAFEMDIQKPFDAIFAENLKNDSKIKESDIAIKSEKKVEEKSKEKVEAKQEVGAVHTKQEVSMKNAVAREAMRNFASQFREEVMNYKPPITRINLELNPANLGQVAMTISKKGKDLQVSITSNANVMTMFVQNAQELRQNLMQIGFNNLDLNFSTHDGQGSGAQNNDSQEQKEGNLKIQSIEEAEAQVELGNVPQSVEITLPQYA